MLLKNSNLSRLNYQLVRTHIRQKYKDNKGQEPSKTNFITGIMAHSIIQHHLLRQKLFP